MIRENKCTVLDTICKSMQQTELHYVDIISTVIGVQ